MIKEGSSGGERRRTWSEDGGEGGKREEHREGKR